MLIGTKLLTDATTDEELTVSVIKLSNIDPNNPIIENFIAEIPITSIKF
jgi:uncharacterized metal-binding protein YceD (DUF177 family)